MRIWEHLPKGCLEPCQTCVMELTGPKMTNGPRM